MRTLAPIAKMACLAAVLMHLAGCNSTERDTTERFPLPDTQAFLLLVNHPFGGGAGSVDRAYYIVNGGQRQAIATFRTLYPPASKLDLAAMTLRLTSCKAAIQQSARSSNLPYGETKPIAISVKNETDCGY